MSINSFETLTIHEQDEMLMVHGTHLFKYDQEDRAFEVYKLFDFFVKLRRNSSNKEAREVYEVSINDDVQYYEHHIFALLGDF